MHRGTFTVNVWPSASSAGRWLESRTGQRAEPSATRLLLPLHRQPMVGNAKPSSGSVWRCRDRSPQSASFGRPPRLTRPLCSEKTASNAFFKPVFLLITFYINLLAWRSHADKPWVARESCPEYYVLVCVSKRKNGNEVAFLSKVSPSVQPQDCALMAMRRSETSNWFLRPSDRSRWST